MLLVRPDITDFTEHKLWNISDRSDLIHLMCGLPLFRLPSPISIIGFSNLSLSTHPWGARSMAASFLQLVMRKPDWLLQGQTCLFSWTTTPAPHLVAVNSFPFPLFDGPWLAYIHYYWLPYSKQSMTITLVLVINYKLRNYNWIHPGGWRTYFYLCIKVPLFAHKRWWIVLRDGFLTFSRNLFCVTDTVLL